MMGRGIVLVLILIAVAVADPVARARRRAHLRGRVQRRAGHEPDPLLLRGPRADELPSRAAEGDFDPQHEFMLQEWIPIHIGPLDMSVNKAVAYLWVGGLVTILLGIWLMRFGLSLRPDRRQTTGEAIYELVQAQIAESSLPSKALRLWFPYVASLFLFIWVLNIVGFIPLPISDEKFDVFGVDAPDLGHLRGDRQPERDARARADHVRRHARRGHPLQRRRPLLQELDPGGGAEAAPRADRPARGHLAVHAADLALGPTLRQHARGPHADPRHARPDLHLLGLVAGPVLGPRRDRHLPLRGRDRRHDPGLRLRAALGIYIGAAIEPEH